jgi:hypothetical protein
MNHVISFGGTRAVQSMIFVTSLVEPVKRLKTL